MVNILAYSSARLLGPDQAQQRINFEDGEKVQLQMGYVSPADYCPLGEVVNHAPATMQCEKLFVEVVSNALYVLRVS